MNYIYQIILGAFQGLTEFLPVSSSGHLALIQKIFNSETKESLLIEVTAHFGSLLAIFVYYRKPVLNTIQNYATTDKRSSLKWHKISTLFVSTLPAGIAGLFLIDFILPLFSSLNIVAICFLITSALLIFGFKTSEQYAEGGSDWPNHQQALIIGFAQAFALLPGISRSGSTISTGVALGVKPKPAAFFSFCSVAPLIGAATLLNVVKLIKSDSLENSIVLGELFTLLISSFLFGWLGLTLVIKFLESDKFKYFAFYLIPLALTLLIWGNL
jgi:undecaprenyl-diphosphatase